MYQIYYFKKKYYLSLFKTQKFNLFSIISPILLLFRNHQNNLGVLIHYLPVLKNY